jgi:hypothetical protein
MSIGESEAFMKLRSLWCELNPQIDPPFRPLIMKKQRAIITIGNNHQKEKSPNSDPDISITSFLIC